MPDGGDTIGAAHPFPDESNLRALVLVATVTSLPVSYWGAQQWLASFALRIEPGAGLLLAALAVLVVAAGAISQQAWRAMNTQPMEALRHE